MSQLEDPLIKLRNPLVYIKDPLEEYNFKVRIGIIYLSRSPVNR